MEQMPTIEIGAAKLSVLNIGDIGFRLKDVMSVQEDLWRPRYAALFDSRLRFPCQRCPHFPRMEFNRCRLRRLLEARFC